MVTVTQPPPPSRADTPLPTKLISGNGFPRMTPPSSLIVTPFQMALISLATTESHEIPPISLKVIVGPVWPADPSGTIVVIPVLTVLDMVIIPVGPPLMLIPVPPMALVTPVLETVTAPVGPGVTLMAVPAVMLVTPRLLMVAEAIPVVTPMAVPARILKFPKAATTLLMVTIPVFSTVTANPTLV